MEEKDKLIASLRHQLREALSKCSALEQENAFLSSLIDKNNSLSIRQDNNGIINMGTFNAPVVTNMGDVRNVENIIHENNTVMINNELDKK